MGMHQIPEVLNPGHITGLENLLTLEAQVRQCQTLKQLQFLIANETSKLIPACQIIVMSGAGKLEINTISSLATLNKTSPTLRWLQHSLIDNGNFKSAPQVETDAPGNVLAGRLDGKNAPGSPWPFCNVLQLKLDLRKSATGARVYLLNNNNFTNTDHAMAERLAQTYAHAWDALTRSGFSIGSLFSRKLAIGCSIAVIAMLFIPVTMSVLAPVEITAHQPGIITAPLNGVIGTIKVTPNEKVKTGQLLFAYTPTDLENESAIASQNVEVAKSRYRRASQDAFNANGGRREMAELKSELDLALANLKHANARMELSKVRANRDGVVLFSDVDDWVGKPVITGEKIMKIANPERTEYKIRLAISDSIMLEDGDSARVFLDTDPLNPVLAKITRRSYHAKSDDQNTMSYELFAQPKPTPGSTDTINHRIGVRGTAQLFGAKVSLAMFLFRKPLSAFRQYAGF